MSWRENNRGERGGYSRGGRGRGGNYRGGGGFRGGYRGRPFNKRTQNDHFHDGKRTKFDVSNRLKEVDIGVTEFIGDHEHFAGIFKERFGDFHVHEITVDNVIAKLTTQDIPSDPESVINLKILEDDVVNKLTASIKTLNDPDSEINSFDFEVTDMSKEQRRVAHQLVKQNASIRSQTIEKDNKKFMSITKHNSSKTDKYAQKYYRDTHVDWSQREGLYCHFLLHKVNLDTMDALNQLAMNSRSKSNSFSYAGTKDRRARTTQWISIKRMEPKIILEAGYRVRGAYVGNFKYAKEPLKLGMLNGNRFTIALRNVSATNDEIERAMTSLRDNGFINYYGLQRFGSVAAIPTYEIGKALLQGKWNEAIDLILKPRSGEPRDMTEAREIYAKTKDAGAALKRMYRMDKIEAKLLRGIQLNGPTNPQGALDLIPRNTRLMYIHSYQSYIWNNVVSRRIREFGCKPIVGDLVYEKSFDKSDTETLDYLLTNDGEDGHEMTHESKVTNANPHETVANSEETYDNTSAMKEEIILKPVDSDERIEESEENSKADIEMKVDNVADEKSAVDNSIKNVEVKENEGETDSSPLPAVKSLTEDDLKNYSLADVVMPQPGWRVIYPAYAKAWYEELLSNDELNIELKQKNKKYSLGGAYRRILQLPENLTWRIMNYKEIHDELIRSDIDELRGNEGPKDNPDGKYKALILEMSLKPSTYATMALREILKHDTSAETQAAQSAAYHAQDKAENEKINNSELNQDEAAVDEVGKVMKEVENKMGIADDKEENELPMEAEPIEITTVKDDRTKE
ncbi:hypothetical protein PV327_005775 [Microctonus hyperodae]|uniref:TRUD domain-containing protein n=1 Tax=Microctonus hyperodae TaxID=165561 RepID=A0AA39L022_MICHY|nr:hypothetical protein PV327_005775 [Microctonus hyperodae]